MSLLLQLAELGQCCLIILLRAGAVGLLHLSIQSVLHYIVCNYYSYLLLFTLSFSFCFFYVSTKTPQFVNLLYVKSIYFSNINFVTFLYYKLNRYIEVVDIFSVGFFFIIQTQRYTMVYTAVR